MQAHTRLIGSLVLVSAVALVAALIFGGMPVRGAKGLDSRADATAKACRSLAAGWQDGGAVPDKIVIRRKTRPVINLSDVGVVPGGDVRQPLQEAFDLAATMAAPVLFLPPTEAEEHYQRSGRVTLAAEGADFCAYGAHFVGTDEADLGLGLEADKMGLFGLTMEAPEDAFTMWPEIWEQSEGEEPPSKFPSGDSKFGAWASHVLVLGAADLVLRDVNLLGAKRGGVRLFGGSNVLIEGACVYRPHSDGIHIVNGSEQITVRDSRIIESGDDCISVVTYDRDKQPQTVSDILITENICEGSRTRGLTVIGGEDVDIVDNDVRDTLMAGILLYPSPTHNTYPVSNVSVEGNRLDGAGLRRDNCNNCGDIVVNDPGGMVLNVTVGENDVTERPAGSPVRTDLTCVPSNE